MQSNRRGNKVELDGPGSCLLVQWTSSNHCTVQCVQVSQYNEPSHLHNLTFSWKNKILNLYAINDHSVITPPPPLHPQGFPPSPGLPPHPHMCIVISTIYNEYLKLPWLIVFHMYWSHTDTNVIHCIHFRLRL